MPGLWATPSRSTGFFAIYPGRNSMRRLTLSRFLPFREGAMFKNRQAPRDPSVEVRDSEIVLGLRAMIQWWSPKKKMSTRATRPRLERLTRFAVSC